MSEVTQLLNALAQGDPQAASQLLPIVYDQLRELAAQRLAQEKPGQTLQATALVHEAYLRLVGHDPRQHWDGRGHFFAAAAEAMRRILVERARRKRRQKHGGGRRRLELNEAHGSVEQCVEQRNDEILAVDEALGALAHVDTTAAALVKLHFFAGLPLREAADALGISERTAYRDWAYARAWLARFLDRAAPSGEQT